MAAYEPMRDMIDHARKQGIWLRCHSLCFSPDELMKLQKNGDFKPECWELINPREFLDELVNEVNRAQERVDDFLMRMTRENTRV